MYRKDAPWGPFCTRSGVPFTSRLTSNFAINLLLLGVSFRARAMVALAKGGAMGLFGLWLAGATLWHIQSGVVPAAPVMGVVGIAALIANARVLLLLMAYPSGEANICALSGSAPATLGLEMRLSWRRRQGFSAQAAAGQMSSSRPSWLRLRCGARPRLLGMLLAKFACGLKPSQRSRLALAVVRGNSGWGCLHCISDPSRKSDACDRPAYHCCGRLPSPLSQLRFENHTMIVAVIPMRMMEMITNAIVDVVSVWHRLTPASRTVDVRMIGVGGAGAFAHNVFL